MSDDFPRLPPFELAPALRQLLDTIASRPCEESPELLAVEERTLIAAGVLAYYYFAARHQPEAMDAAMTSARWMGLSSRQCRQILDQAWKRRAIVFNDVVDIGEPPPTDAWVDNKCCNQCLSEMKRWLKRQDRCSLPNWLGVPELGVLVIQD
jgi:hypothetical protein